MKMVLITYDMYKIWSVIVCVLFILKEAGCYHISVQSKCEDVYIWYGDGSVDCEYLITPSNYGLHKRPRFFCTQYPMTRCCETCAFLRRHEYKVTNGVHHPSGSTSLPTTLRQRDRILFSVPTSLQEITTKSVPRTKPDTSFVQSKCEDVHIWYADTSVDCKYLITPSNFGVHKRPRYFCTEYPMTECCETCALLRRHEYKLTSGVHHPSGSTSLSTTKQPDRILFNIPTSRPKITTRRVPRTEPVTSSVQSKCEDVHIWYGDGSVDCKYLITPSNFGVHKRPQYFCTEYPMTECCGTCALLRRHEYKLTNEVHNPSGSTSLPTTPKKPDRILFNVPTSRQEITTKSMPRTEPVTTSAQPACEDSYIWLFDGRVDCQFLVTPTVYGLHTNQKFYCVEYPFTRCCNTCAFLKIHNYNYINGIDNPTTTEPSTTTVAVLTQPTNFNQTFNTMQQTVGDQEIVPNNLLSSNENETAAVMLQLTEALNRHITQSEITTEQPTNIHRTIKMFFNALATMQTQNPHHMLQGASQSKITSQTPTQTPTITTTTTPVPTTTTPVPTTTTTTPVPTTTTTTPVPTTTTTTPVPTTTTTTPVPTTTTTTPVPTTTTTTPVPTTTTTTPVPTTTTTTPVPTTTTTTPVPTTTTTTPVPTTTKAPVPLTKRVTVAKRKVVARPKCVDVGIWIISGSVGCEYLETDSKYGLNKNQMYFCLRYPLTSCCETCGRLMRSQSTNLRKQP